MKRTGKNPLESSALFQNVENIDIEKERAELGITPKEPGYGRSDNLVRTKGVQQGLPEDLQRTTIILPVDLVHKMKDYAYTERITIKTAYERAISQFLEGKELLNHEERATK